jgi:hypothetical protein
MNRLLILALALTAACVPTEPLTASLTGQWVGSVVRPGGPGTIVVFTANITQNGPTLTGTGGIADTTGLPVRGTMSETRDVIFSYRIEDTAVPANPPRFVYFQGSVANNGRMDGILVDWHSLPLGIQFKRQ